MLDIYHSGTRSYEFLKQLKLNKPTNAIDRENNKERIRQAEAVAVARAAELQANDYNMVTNLGKKTIVTDWMQAYVNDYTKKDKRNMQGALNRFKAFLGTKKRNALTFSGLNPLLIEEFITYLEANSTGEGASSYYNRFKKMVRHAYRRHLMRENVLDFVQAKVHDKAKRKDILTIDELKTLASTPTESDEVKRAFIFCTVTGLRWIDVKSLTWNKINLSNKQNADKEEGYDIADYLIQFDLSDFTRPRWYVNMQGILHRYQAGEIAGDQFLDMQDKNLKQSGLSAKE